MFQSQGVKETVLEELGGGCEMEGVRVNIFEVEPVRTIHKNVKQQ